MTRELIIEELNNKGYKAEAMNSIKNGVELEGIRILTGGNVSPVIYTEAFIKEAEEENKSLDEVVEAIINLYENRKAFDFDVEKLYDKEFILNSLFIGVQKTSKEEITKRDCELAGIESYLYIRKETEKDGMYSIKVRADILKNANVSEEEAWTRAEDNTFEETTLESMAKVISDMMGIEYNEDMERELPFYVITNKSKIKGASAILNKKVLSEFGERFGAKKLVCLPSSIHEMLICPYVEDVELETFSEMVSEVNNTQVEPTERLTDNAYIITL